MTQAHPPPAVQPERINLNDKVTTEAWTKKLNATREQLREAVAAVGDRVTDVEIHLKAIRRISPTDWMMELSTSH
jgi:hypothetical protein